MKKVFFFSLVSEALLLCSTAQGQYKYTKKSNAVSIEKKTYHYVSQENNSSENKGAALSLPGRKTKALQKNSPTDGSGTTDPPIINDAIDIYVDNAYDDNPILLQASVTIHFGNVNAGGPVFVEFSGDPYYDFHDASHISINRFNYSSITSNAVCNIPLYINSDNHWTVTFQDFVTKWNDSMHTQLDHDSWERLQSGQIGLQLAGNNTFQINKMILVLKFTKGTKTIVWDTPKNSTSITNKIGTFGYLYFKFNQNFEPMN
jgi:hypothetical protein